MELSIIIVSWNVKEFLRNCLTSLFEQKFDFDFEVIVIDNNSTDETANMVLHDFPQVKLIANKQNLGFAVGNNQGLKIAQGNYYLLLNPDTKFINNSLNLAVKKMHHDQNIGILGGRILNPVNSLQSSVRKFPTWQDHIVMMFKLHHLFKLNQYLATDFNYQIEQEVDQVMGAFLLLNKKLAEKIGWLDEKFYIWFEEVDYCLRAKKSGFKVLYFPLTEIIHYGGQSFKQIYFKKQWYFSQSRLHYVKQHDNWLIYLLILILTPLSICLSWLNIKHGK